MIKKWSVLVTGTNHGGYIAIDANTAKEAVQAAQALLNEDSDPEVRTALSAIPRIEEPAPEDLKAPAEAEEL